MKRIVVAALAVFVVGLELGCVGGGEPLGMTEGERARYVDQKGHYRPEFAARGEVIGKVR